MIRTILEQMIRTILEQMIRTIFELLVFLPRVESLHDRSPGAGDELD